MTCPAWHALPCPVLYDGTVRIHPWYKDGYKLKAFSVNALSCLGLTSKNRSLNQVTILDSVYLNIIYLNAILSNLIFWRRTNLTSFSSMFAQNYYLLKLFYPRSLVEPEAHNAFLCNNYTVKRQICHTT